MSTTNRFRPALLVVMLLAGVAPAGPIDPLLRLVPPDAALGFVVQDLREHTRAVGRSPFADWFQDSPLGKALLDNPETAKLRGAIRQFREAVQVDDTELLNDVFGNAIVFAFCPNADGRNDDEAGLLLIMPRNPDLMRRLIREVNDLQTASGEVRSVRESSYRGRDYTTRDQTAKGSEHYLFHDGIFALSGSERLLRELIDRDLDGPPVAERVPALAERLRRLGVTDRMAFAWLNPRHFDGELAQSAAQAADPAERAILTQFGNIWEATDGLAASLHPDRGLELALTISVRPDRFPAELTRVLFPPAGGSSLWTSVPGEAILAVGGRLDAPKWIDALGSFLPDGERRNLHEAISQSLGPVFGKNRLPGVIRGLGPDWVAWVAAPTDEGLFPRGAVAVRLEDDETTRSVALALDLAMQLVRIQYNQTHDDQIDFAERRANGTEFRFLAGPEAFPEGWTPGYAVKGRCLVLATDPETVATFTPSSDGNTGPVPLARLSARHLREYLTPRRAALAGLIATGQGRSPAEVEGELERLIIGLGPFDRAELRFEAREDLLQLVLTVELVKPLK